MDRYGIHAAKKCWTVAPVGVKPVLAEALLQEEDALQAHYLGRLVLGHCRLNAFKRSRKQWQEVAEGAERKRKMFADFLDGDAPVTGGGTSSKKASSASLAKASAPPPPPPGGRH
jgi:hypothetical protein